VGQFEAARDGRLCVSFTFGIPPADTIAAIKARGMLLLGTATTVDEAIAVEKVTALRSSHSGQARAFAWPAGNPPLH